VRIKNNGSLCTGHIHFPIYGRGNASYIRTQQLYIFNTCLSHHIDDKRGIPAARLFDEAVDIASFCPPQLVVQLIEK
jgi:hypothetical protein